MRVNSFTMRLPFLGYKKHGTHFTSSKIGLITGLEITEKFM
jgi:hypothetical protein